MIVTNNTLFSLNFITGTWQSELGLLVSSIYVVFVYGNAPLVGDADLSKGINSISNAIVVYHTFNMIVKFVRAFYPGFNYISFGVIIFNTTFYLAILIGISSIAYDFRYSNVTMSTRNEGFLEFLFLEMYCFIANITAYAIFLLFRTCTKNKMLVDSEVPVHKRLTQLDTVIGLLPLANMFVNSCYPCVVSLLISYFDLASFGSSNAAVVDTQRFICLILSSG